jgi:hypothetical protein
MSLDLCNNASPQPPTADVNIVKGSFGSFGRLGHRGALNPYPISVPMLQT